MLQIWIRNHPCSFWPELEISREHFEDTQVGFVSYLIMVLFSFSFLDFNNLFAQIGLDLELSENPDQIRRNCFVSSQHSLIRIWTTHKKVIFNTCKSKPTYKYVCTLYTINIVKNLQVFQQLSSMSISVWTVGRWTAALAGYLLLKVDRWVRNRRCQNRDASSCRYRNWTFRLTLTDFCQPDVELMFIRRW